MGAGGGRRGGGGSPDARRDVSVEPLGDPLLEDFLVRRQALAYGLASRVLPAADGSS